ncbi:FecCD family ABC transporter permease [Trueperella pyogenes]|uniref:FecCD family ABC transporter permease n=1 Tax=Trueperella pyogenes TaxID=1661 RepID=UPI000D259198|nr:iron ABC transporter permease [Trueperella pyogenes]AWA43624.1 iron ABC transporter permease [Trueperella pyogenes]
MVKSARIWLHACVCVAASFAIVALRLIDVVPPADAPWLYEEVWRVVRDRLLAAIAVGAALGVAGVLLRTATSNPLADPQITGVNAGAAFGAVVTTFATGATHGAYILPGALAGGALAAGLTISLSLRGSSPDRNGANAIQRMVLLGIAVSAVFSALTAILLVLDEAQLSTVLAWLNGRLAGVRWPDVVAVVVALAVILPVAAYAGRAFDILATGDGISRSVGANPGAIRKRAVVIAVVLAATCVAAAGPIGFLGLLAAVVASRVCGARHRIALPFAALVGATVLLIADSVGQMFWAPAETPVGILTGIAGTPLLLWGIRSVVAAPKKGGA